jgi:hypothetical protein
MELKDSLISMHTFMHTLRTLRPDRSMDSEPGEREDEAAIIFLKGDCELDGERGTAAGESDEGELASEDRRLDIMRLRIEFGVETQPRNSRI